VPLARAELVGASPPVVMRFHAFFGAPIAHEDDAERACRAALEILEWAGEVAARPEDLVAESLREPEGTLPSQRARR